MKNEIERTRTGDAEILKGGLNFGHALFWLKGGFQLRRPRWEVRWIELRNIYGRDVIGTVAGRDGVWQGPYIAAQEDLLAEDWEILA